MDPAEEIRFRQGRLDDSRIIAEMTIEAGGGAVEFLLEGMSAGATPADLLARAVADPSDILSYRNTILAEAGGTVIGMAATYPAEHHRITDDMRRSIPADRLDVVAPFFEARVDGSLFVSALFVDPAWRSRGIGRALLERTVARAAAVGRDRVSLAVFSANAGARRLYGRCGFKVVAVVRFPAHPRLPHAREALVMATAVPLTRADGR